MVNYRLISLALTWQTQRIPVCRALGHPVDGRKGVQQLAIQLDET